MQEIQDIRASLRESYQNYEYLLDRMVFEFNAVVSLGITRSNLVLAFANQNLNLLQKHHDCVATHMEYLKLSAQLQAAKKIMPVAPVVADLSETEHNTTAPQEETDEAQNRLTPEETEHNTTDPSEETEEVHNTQTPEETEHNTTAPQEEMEEVHNMLTPEEMENLEVLLAQLHITQETDNPEVLNLKALLAQLNDAYKNYEEETGPAVMWGEDKAALYRNSNSKIYSSNNINTSGPVETVANLYAGLIIAYQGCERALASVVAKHNSDVSGGIMETTTALQIAIDNIIFVQYYFQLVNTVGRHFMLVAVLKTLMDPTGSEPEVTEEEFKTLMRLQILLE